MMVYDAADRYLVLFGGLADRGGALSDTWTYANGNWTNLTPSLSLSPPSRYKGMIAYDAADGYVLLYGGLRNGGYLADTWMFRAGAWSPIAVPSSPGPLEDAGMTFDPNDGYVLLFGGDNVTGIDLNRTWSYSAGTWTDITGSVAGAPPAEETAPLTYDPQTRSVLLFSGSGPTRVSNETWSYQSNIWRNLTGKTGLTPPGRDSAAMVYDGADGYVLMFGGFHFPNVLGDSWAFVNGSWVALSFSVSPPPRFAQAMAYTPGPGAGNASIVMFSGRPATGNSTNLPDTWTYKVPLTPGVTVQPSVIDVGQTVHIQLSITGGFPPYSVGWPSLPTGCVGLLSPGTFACTPSLPGAELLSALVTDSVNNSATSAPASLTVNPHPKATSIATTTVGTAALLVGFSVSVTGGTTPFTYQWDFGDSGTSPVGNTSHSYLMAGNYSASFSATDAVGTVVAAAPIPIEVTNGLSANASASLYFGAAPLAVSFMARPSGGLGPFAYNWSFGPQGAYNTAMNPVYTFTVPGVYAVQLQVEDALGAVAGSTVSVTVVPLLVADFTSSFPGGSVCSNGVPVANLQLTAQSQGGVGPYNETWSLGPTTIYGPSPLLPVAGGSFVNVTLTTTDTRGTHAVERQTIDAPTASCSVVGAGENAVTPFWIAWVIAAILGVVIIIETLVLLSGRRKGGP
jgi:PKD repeat protein